MVTHETEKDQHICAWKRLPEESNGEKSKNCWLRIVNEQSVVNKKNCYAELLLTIPYIFFGKRQLIGLVNGALIYQVIRLVN